MDNETFEYHYCPKDQEEVQQIRQKYLPREETPLEQLRRLDQRVTQKATVLSLAAGILGTLILGVGMCCCLVWADALFVPGIVIGLVGIAILACAYPLYCRTLRRERQRIAPEIFRLSDELLK